MPQTDSNTKSASGSDANSPLQEMVPGDTSGGTSASAGAASKGSDSAGSGADVVESPHIDEVNFERMWDYLKEQATEWVEGLVELVPEILLSLFVLALALSLSLLIGVIVSRFLRPRMRSEAAPRMITRVVQVLIVLGALFFALGLMGLDRAAISVMGGVGILAIALGFAFRDILENLIIGVMMAIRKPFEIGDVVESNGYFGHVRGMNLRNTILETFLGQKIIIPNKEVYMNPIENYVATGYRKLEFEAPVPYDADLDAWTKAVEAELSELDFVENENQVEIYGMGFGDWAYRFIVRVQIAYPSNSYFQTKDASLRALNRAYRKSGISVPWPGRNVHLMRDESTTTEDEDSEATKGSSKDEQRERRGDGTPEDDD